MKEFRHPLRNINSRPQQGSEGLEGELSILLIKGESAQVWEVWDERPEETDKL